MARKNVIDPLAETPFWRTRAFVFACVGAGVLAFAGLTAYLVKENRRQQLQRRIDEDPLLAHKKQKLTAQIAAAKPGDERAPRALWLGVVKRVAKLESGTGTGSSILIEMESPDLLAGTRGKKDAEPLAISGQGFPFSVREPRAGETWMIAVRRDKDERALVFAADRAELGK